MVKDKYVLYKLFLFLQKKRLVRVGGKNAKNATLELLKKMFDDEVAKEYNWTGSEMKENFSALGAVKLIIGSHKYIE